MRIAFVFSSKDGTASSLQARRYEENHEEDDPPLDFLAECDSDETIGAVVRALGERHEIIPIEADDEAYLHLKEIRPDLVFNMAEGLVGPNRESHIPAICEMLGIPHTGSDPLTLGICLDKSRAKEILAYHKIHAAVLGGGERLRDKPQSQAPGHRQTPPRRLEQGDQGQRGREDPGRA